MIKIVDKIEAVVAHTRGLFTKSDLLRVGFLNDLNEKAVTSSIQIRAAKVVVAETFASCPQRLKLK